MFFGVSVELRAEWLQGALSVVPVIIAVAWVLRGTSARWRDALWPIVGELDAVAVVPVWCGWRARLPSGETVLVRGGLWGVRVTRRR